MADELAERRETRDGSETLAAAPTPTPTVRVVTLSEDEQESVNLATAALTLAKLQLKQVWGPIRSRYNLPDAALYERETGRIVIEAEVDDG